MILKTFEKAINVLSEEHGFWNKSDCVCFSLCSQSSPGQGASWGPSGGPCGAAGGQAGTRTGTRMSYLSSPLPEGHQEGLLMDNTHFSDQNASKSHLLNSALLH